MSSRATEQFARLLVELQPYLHEIVFVGGWVHTLYLAEEHDTAGVGTDDIDITLPAELLAGARPTLAALALRAGFERDPVSEMEGAATWMVYYNDDGDTVPIDFLTEGSPRESVEIRGQDGLVAQAYSGQRMLLENTRQMRTGQWLHALLKPERLIRVPTLGAYVIQKGVSAGTRLHTMKRAKDLVYILEIISHPQLGPIAFDQLPGISRRYGREAEAFRRVIEETIETPALLDDVVEQMVISRGRRADPAATRTVYKGWLLRLLAEG